MSTAELATLTDDQVHAGIEQADNEVAEAEAKRDALIAERRRRHALRVSGEVQDAIAFAFSRGKRGAPMPAGRTLPQVMADVYRTMAPTDYGNYAVDRTARNDRNLARSHDAALDRAAHGSY